jgi:hypothetical protein
MCATNKRRKRNKGHGKRKGKGTASQDFLLRGGGGVPPTEPPAVKIWRWASANVNENEKKEWHKTNKPFYNIYVLYTVSISFIPIGLVKDIFNHAI